MTEKEALEKLKKEIHDLADQKQLLVLQVHELTLEKRTQESRLQEAKKRALEIETENNTSVENCVRKVKQVLAGAEAKESEFITKLQTLKVWEQELSEKEDSQQTLSVSLDNRMAELAKERSEFDAGCSRRIKEVEGLWENAETAVNEKYAALSRETTKHEKLVTELDQKQAVHAESHAGIQAARGQLESERIALQTQKQELLTLQADIQRRENDSNTTLGKQKHVQQELDTRAAQLSARERAIHDREVVLDLKRREAELLDKKVKSLINIHKLEAELASHS